MTRTSAVIAIASIVAFGQPARAQSPPAATGNPFASATGGFFALSVPDLEASVRWYTEKLGMRRIMTIPRTGTIAGLAALETDGLIVELIQRDSARSPVGAADMTYSIAKVGIIVSDFDGTVAALHARGVELMGPVHPAQPTVRANLAFKDNAGNMIQVMGPYAKQGAKNDN